MENQDQKSEDQQFQEEIVDVEAFTQEGKTPPQGKKYRIRVGDNRHVFEMQVVTGKEVLQKAGFGPVECYWLYLKLKGRDFEKIDPNEAVDLAKPGVEQFIVKPTEVFNYFVDDEPETTDQKELTANQILEAAGLTPVSDYYLVRLEGDGNHTSFKDNPTAPIKMVCPAVKFVSAFRGETGVS